MGGAESRSASISKVTEEPAQTREREDSSDWAEDSEGTGLPGLEEEEPAVDPDAEEENYVDDPASEDDSDPDFE